MSKLCEVSCEVELIEGQVVVHLQPMGKIVMTPAEALHLSALLKQAGIGHCQPVVDYLPIARGHVRIRDDDGPTDNLGPQQEFLIIEEGKYIPMNWLKQQPVTLPHQVHWVDDLQTKDGLRIVQAIGGIEDE